MLDSLEAANRAPKRNSHLGILDGRLQNPPGATRHPGALGYLSLNQYPLHYQPAPVHFSQHILFGHNHIVEDNLALLLTGHGLQYLNLDAICLCVHQEEGNSFFLIRTVPGPGHTEEVIGYMSIGDKEFCSIDDEILLGRGSLDSNARRL